MIVSCLRRPNYALERIRKGLIDKLKILLMMGSKRNTTRVVELEKRVDVAMQGLNLFLFKGAEEISPKERRVLQRRLQDYTTEKRAQFVELNKYLQSHTAQESD